MEAVITEPKKAVLSTDADATGSRYEQNCRNVAQMNAFLANLEQNDIALEMHGVQAAKGMVSYQIDDICLSVRVDKPAIVAELSYDMNSAWGKGREMLTLVKSNARDYRYAQAGFVVPQKYDGHDRPLDGCLQRAAEKMAHLQNAVNNATAKRGVVHPS